MSSAAHRRNQVLLPASALFGLALILYGLCQASLPEILSGLYTIFTVEDVLITDYIAVGGAGAAFVNAGLVTLVSTLILEKWDDTPNGATMVTVGLMAGFSLFGKNLVNMWPIFFGTVFYALVKGERFTAHVNLALRGTALAPMVSFMAVRFHPWLGVVMGLAVGFLLPPVAEHAHRVQNGMNLYSVGFSCGLLAMMMVPAFKAFGLDPASAHHWSTGGNVRLGLALAALCAILIVAGLSRGPGQVLRRYWALLHTSGRVPSDYVRTFTPGPVLVNMGVNGLIATGYIVLTGGDLNGATIGAIFTILGFSGYGKHAFNIVPVMAGVLLGSLTNHVDPNSSSLQLAGLFGTTLAPFAGVFGWPFGVLAGLLHSSVVLQAGLPLEGMNLYNNGFSGGLVAIVLYPILTSLVERRRPVLMEEDLFAMFDSNEPQPPEDLPGRERRQEDRRSGRDRRSGEGAWNGEERRSGHSRRTEGERRSGKQE
ncbi:MAG: DUF1576 domain-containing protein [Oscillospiraceae bacterium]|nr:DUF1576 domain-containing protein [Oscillospiraceae bacterium]